MKRYKFIAIILILASLFLVVTSCSMFGRVKEVTPDEFKDALCEIYGIEEADINSFAIDGGEHAEGWSFSSTSKCYIYLTKNFDCAFCDASEDAHDRFASSYNEFENLEEAYSVDDVRRRISDDMGYLIFTTSDMEMINEYSPVDPCPDDCDSLLLAYYYSGTTVIVFKLYYDSNNSEVELEPYYEFVEILDLPSL